MTEIASTEVEHTNEIDDPSTWDPTYAKLREWLDQGYTILLMRDGGEGIVLKPVA